MNLKRLEVINEAEKWLNTPFHEEARVLNHGVDCGQLLIMVYGQLGYMPLDYPIPHYDINFACHRDEEWYLQIVKNFAHEVQLPLPGDVVLFKWGRLFSHGGIVVEWPLIIHAWAPARKVLFFDVSQNSRLWPQPRKFFSPFEDI